MTTQRKTLRASEHALNTSANYVPYCLRAVREPTDFHPRVERFYQRANGRNGWEEMKLKILEKA